MARRVIPWQRLSETERRISFYYPITINGRRPRLCWPDPRYRPIAFIDLKRFIGARRPLRARHPMKSEKLRRLREPATKVHCLRNTIKTVFISARIPHHFRPREKLAGQTFREPTNEFRATELLPRFLREGVSLHLRSH